MVGIKLLILEDFENVRVKILLEEVGFYNRFLKIYCFWIFYILYCFLVKYEVNNLFMFCIFLFLGCCI